MHIKTRNVNTAFREIISGIKDGCIETKETSSRNGTVLMIEEPVIISYSHPRERVLFNQARDINPFALLYEALWMLAGRNDVAPLAYYTKQFQEYSDDGETLNGAYGYRWRHASAIKEDVSITFPDGFKHEGFYAKLKLTDQLQVLISHLKKNPSSRRALLSMWNVEDDLLKIDSSKDVCCNLNVLFFIENGLCNKCNNEVLYKGIYAKECGKCKGFPHGTPRYLHMTVFNRSNDAIWGALGANFVTFSLLQEYMACCLGLDVGTYNQVSNNLHVYTETNSGWKPEEWLKCDDDSWYPYNDQYLPKINFVPLVQDQATFDKEVQEFVNTYPLKDNEPQPEHSTIPQSDIKAKWSEPFIRNVAQPMCNAFMFHKLREYKMALGWVEAIKADDWRLASMNWIKRRQLNWEKKHAQV